MIYIYALRCPVAKATRYIGKSTNPDRRMREHLRSAVNGVEQHHRARWLRSLLKQDLVPEIEILRGLPDDAAWQDIERQVIAEHLAAGCRLTNLTLGGDGIADMCPEIRQRIRESLAETNKRADVRAARSAASREHWVRRKASMSAEDYQKLREKRSRDMKRNWSDPAAKAARLATLHAPEVKAVRYANRDTPEKTAARIAKLKEAWADPVRRAKRCGPRKHKELSNAVQGQ